MNELFDVFFHQKAVPAVPGTVLYEIEKTPDLAEQFENTYREVFDKSVKSYSLEELQKRISKHVSLKKYLEIQFFQVELNWDVLLEELKEVFPQFIWTKVIEEISGVFSTYSCEFIPLAFEENELAEFPFKFGLSESMKQMGYTSGESISEIIEERLVELLQEEETSNSDMFKSELEVEEELSFPVEMTMVEDSEEETELQVETEQPTIAKKSKSKKKQETKHKQNEFLPSLEEKETDLAIRSDESEILYLKESLKREKASKDRLKVTKERLEQELLAIENNLLVSGLKRFKSHRKSEVDEEDWYKTVKVDLVKYDDLYKKAKFIDQSWKLNRELVTITEKMILTKDEVVYERARVEKVKNSVSELDLQSMMEQCHLINSRVRISRGLFFIKPSVKMYQIDFEQLEKISAFFDIIQTENRLLERIIEEKNLSNEHIR